MNNANCVEYTEGPSISRRLNFPRCLWEGADIPLPAVRAVQPIARDKLYRLHEAIRRAVPALDPFSGVELSSSLLSELDRRAMDATEAQAFKAAYLEANILKRYQGTDIGDQEDRVATAVEKLLDTEMRCSVVNAVFWPGSEALDLWYNGIPEDTKTVLRRARRILHGILGEFPWDEFPSFVGFSSGATSELPRRKAAAHNKWSRGSHITARALPYGIAFRRWCGLGAHADWPPFQVVDANVVFTVPKRFDRDRTACKGATWNVALQKGVGGLIRQRLQRSSARLLLPDAQEYHGVLAKVAAATGLLVTHDGESASDCIATQLIHALFPASWAKVLMDLREEVSILPDGSRITLEKLSSMGNGYTFEVETALFYALVKACCGKGSLVSVYGDDIIYPVQYFDRVSYLLMFCGISSNRDKTFAQGPFRESCGAHYHGSVDVKPFYLQELPADLGDVIHLHNELVRWHGRGAWSPEWARVRQLCRECVPRCHWGPHGVSGVLWSEWDETSPPVFFKPHLSFVVWQVGREAGGSFPANHPGALMSTLWKGSRRWGEREPYSPVVNKRPANTIIRGTLRMTPPVSSYEDADTKMGKLTSTPLFVHRTQWTARGETPKQ